LWIDFPKTTVFLFAYAACYAFYGKAVWKVKKKLLFTKNFTIITLGTLISAIGDAAMTFALGLIVFDQTQSTWLSGVYMATAIVPGMTLPVLLGPAIDRINRKHVIVALDAVNGLWYLLFMLYLRRNGFVYGAYVAFSFVCGCIGSVYSLAYQCLYPDLIPDGMAQQGYAVSGMIYPLAMTLVTPLAALAYERWGAEPLFVLEGILLLLAAAFESRIDYRHERRQQAQTLRQYAQDMAEGWAYLKKEKGLCRIYGYMMITNAAGAANGKMAMAHFQTSSVLTTAMYGLLTSAETIGRLAGSAVQTLIRIPEEKRYAMTVRVYMLYETCDGIMLFCAYPVMLILRFLCGFFGSQTAAIRSAAVQNYLPADMRARVNGLFSVLMSAGQMAVQLAAGFLGEVVPYRMAALMFALVSFGAVLVLIVRGRRQVEPVYNHPA